MADELKMRRVCSVLMRSLSYVRVASDKNCTIQLDFVPRFNSQYGCMLFFDQSFFRRHEILLRLSQWYGRESYFVDGREMAKFGELRLRTADIVETQSLLRADDAVEKLKHLFSHGEPFVGWAGMIQPEGLVVGGNDQPILWLNQFIEIGLASFAYKDDARRFASEFQGTVHFYSNHEVQKRLEANSPIRKYFDTHYAGRNALLGS